MSLAEQPTTGAPQFTLVRKGYDPDEVESFLKANNGDVETSLLTAQARIAELEAALAEAREREEAIHLTLVAATKTKEELLGAAQRQLDEATQSARAEAERIISESQYEAFKMLTTAKETAEETLEAARNEVEQLRANAKTEADATLTEARREAISVISEIKQEGTRLIAGREEQLRELEAEFEAENTELTIRVNQLRAIAIDLEERMRLIAQGGLPDLMTLNSEVHDVVKRELGPMTVTTPVSAAEDVEGETGRKSFYSRRSAGLPRIGEEASGSVLTGMSALRAASFNHEVDDEEVDDRPADVGPIQASA